MSWEEYYRKIQHNSPRPLLLRALNIIGDSQIKRYAIDLGSGSGMDTIHLLKNEWHVIAIERESIGIERMRNALRSEYKERLTVIHSSFEELDSLPEVDLVYASLSLPFCQPDAFPRLWIQIVQALKENSYFAGHFFGPDDDWTKNGLTGHSESDIKKLFNGFKIEHWAEKNESGPTATGPYKHWHIFSVIAKRETT